MCTVLRESTRGDTLYVMGDGTAQQASSVCPGAGNFTGMQLEQCPASGHSVSSFPSSSTIPAYLVKSVAEYGMHVSSGRPKLVMYRNTCKHSQSKSCLLMRKHVMVASRKSVRISLIIVPEYQLRRREHSASVVVHGDTSHVSCPNVGLESCCGTGERPHVYFAERKEHSEKK